MEGEILVIQFNSKKKKAPQIKIVLPLEVWIFLHQDIQKVMPSFNIFSFCILIIVIGKNQKKKKSLLQELELIQ